MIGEGLKEGRNSRNFTIVHLLKTKVEKLFILFC